MLFFLHRQIYFASGVLSAVAVVFDIDRVSEVLVNNNVDSKLTKKCVNCNTN